MFVFPVIPMHASWSKFLTKYFPTSITTSTQRIGSSVTYPVHLIVCNIKVSSVSYGNILLENKWGIGLIVTWVTGCHALVSPVSFLNGNLSRQEYRKLLSYVQFYFFYTSMTSLIAWILNLVFTLMIVYHVYTPSPDWHRLPINRDLHSLEVVHQMANWS